MTHLHRYHLLDVFTDEIFGGNQLAVFPDAATIAPELMQPIARELNLSETVFVLPSFTDGATHRMRIFTPASELPFAGHPTIGTACLLAALGQVELRGGNASIVFEQGAGNVPVTVHADGQRCSAQLTAARRPELREPGLTREQLAALLSLDADDVLDDARHAPMAVSTGSAFLFVAVRDRAALARCRLDLTRWARDLESAWARNVFVYTGVEEIDAAPIRARMFAPALGIPEDPATGSAATALAGLLASRIGRDGVFTWRMEQGVEMGRPSRLEIEADVRGGVVTATRVGGAAVIVGEGMLRLPR